MDTYKNLEIWNRSVNLATEICSVPLLILSLQDENFWMYRKGHFEKNHHLTQRNLKDDL